MKRSLLALALVGAFAMVAQAANPVVVVKTSMGTIKIELFEDKAPGTVKNFLKYAEDKHYDGTIFHRVISDFMIQGGGFEKGLAKVQNGDELRRKEKKTREPIKNESSNGVLNEKYTVAMARLGSRTKRPEDLQKAADSATAQFFINTKDNDFLNKAKNPDGHGYCVFGKVIEGQDVVDKIKEVKTTDILGGAFENVPAEDVVIESVRRADK